MIKTWRDNLLKWAATQSPPGTPSRIVVPDCEGLDLAALSATVSDSGKNLIVVSNETEAERLLSGLQYYYSLLNFSTVNLQLLPAVVGLRHEWFAENETARCAALHRAIVPGSAIFIATPASILNGNAAPDKFRQQSFELTAGQQDLSPEKLAEALIELDYDNETEVHMPGEFARRGGILDVFSPIHESPLRIEYFGDDIDSMRLFDPETQRSIDDEVESYQIVPRGKAVFSENQAPDKQPDHSFFEYLPEESNIVICSPGNVEKHLRDFADDNFIQVWNEALKEVENRLLFIDNEEKPASTDSVHKRPAEEKRLECYGVADIITPQTPELNESGKTLQWQLVKDSLSYWHNRNYTIAACCGNEGEADRFRELLSSDKKTADIPLEIIPKPLNNGIVIPELKLVLLSEHEIFGKHLTAKTGKKKHRWHELTESTEHELEEGCYAVHATHGICIYHGIVQVEIQAVIQENIKLEFADDKHLYVPLDQAHLVSRYIGGTKNLPQLSKLDSSSWKKKKNTAAQSAQDLAAELLRMEAVRKKSEGESFPSIKEWEHDFQAAFPYEETEDQKRAIQEVLSDMEKNEPMDRLLCGDVGYGKTEVAMRAAFRAVLNNKQVAVLVPTTLLAQQHFLTFRERMAEYPIIIDMISRFRKKSEQNSILERTALGQVDILIGTHRLLSEDIPFNDLGLLVIDEEQRFGVKHKEKIKQLRTSVDVLTMTATPIPRTLYFSLSGLRNLSTIMTPPAERLPVKTHLAQYDEPLIKEAITRELERNGQAFFVHNRVQTIEKFCENLKQIVPEANFSVAHGRMHTDTLEEVMMSFINRETDVLVCTTIIESGLDIPNANTLIVDRADKFGLAELYQLRGRVGRYRQRAYAYMLIPPLSTLPQNAQERLAAIRRHTHLGAGFKLALRDLEIRGAGNILGHAQSGQIASVGFNLYCQLLREAVANLENRTIPEANVIPVRIPGLEFGYTSRSEKTSAFIPEDYVPEEKSRIQLYQQLNSLQEKSGVEKFEAEIRDRFGPLPQPVKNLLEVTRLRVAAQQHNVNDIRVSNKTILLKTDSGYLRNKFGHLPKTETENTVDKIRDIIKFLER